MLSGDLPTPGLKRRPAKSGPPRLYWCARSDLIKAGYRPETVRLHFDETDPAQLQAISIMCVQLQAQMLEWSRGAERQVAAFGGSVLDLSRAYQTDEASPFKRMKFSTREKDTYVLALIERTIGGQRIDLISLALLWKWYDLIKQPRAAGKAPRLRRAWGYMKKLREIFSYGKAAELAGCARVHAILEEVRFPGPGRRRTIMEAAHVVALIPKALEMGRLSLALATAVQFDTILRQKDVIGEWEPIPAGEEATGIILNGSRWVRGLTWSDVVLDGVTRKTTSKTGAIAAHDLRFCPHDQQVAALIPPEKRIGPLIIDEKAGRPYAGDAFQREWRRVARAAGIPDHIWNMDARAGAITEAEDAEAALDDIRSSAGHSQASTTARYSRGAVGKSRKVAKLRIAHRSGENEA